MNKEDILQRLSELGTTAEEIRLSLQKMGIKGTPIAANRCPISNYLKTIPGVANALTNVYHILYYPGETCASIGSYLKVSVPMKDFIMHFDRGDYPELKETPKEKT